MDNILKQYCIKHNIVLHKGDNIHIFCTLAWNWILLLKFHFYKRIHHIPKPIIHYYAVCWNEEKILPFMFDHYKPFVDHFTLYDNHSTDNSLNIIYSRSNTTVIEFDSDGFCDNIHNNIKNSCWKKSRGHADYVIVCDMDEFIHHSDIEKKLSELKHKRISVVKPTGYDMYCDTYPTHLSDRMLTELAPNGVREPMFDKCILFDPHAVVEINFMPGAHECHPWGRIKTDSGNGFKLLHYKNLGIKWLLERYRQYAQRLSQDNIENKYGLQYLKDEDAIISEFQDNILHATKVIE